MMNALIVVSALGLIVGCGYGVQSLLGARSRSFNLAEQGALSWLIGAGVISMLIWLGGFFLRGALLPGFVFVIALLFAFIGWRRRQRLLVGRFSRMEIFLSLVIIAQFVLVLYLSCVHTLGWDGVFNWEAKARYAFTNEGVLPARLFHDAGRRFTHQEYPLCIPFTELWLYFWLGTPDQFCAKMVFPMFYGAGLLLLASFVARFTGCRRLGLLAALLMFFIPQVTGSNGSAIFGYVDFPLGVVYLGAVGFLVRAAQEDDAACWRSYAFCLALLPWMKREGVILWAVAAACGTLVILRTKKPRRAFLAFIPGLLVIIAWSCYLKAMHLPASTEFLALNVSTFESHLNRVGPIATAFASEFYKLSTWGVLWFAVAFGCACLLRRIRELHVALLLVALLLPLTIYVPAYMFSNWPYYLVHVHVSVSRLLLHIVPLGLCIAAFAAAPVPRPVRRPACARSDCERTGAVEFA